MTGRDKTVWCQHQTRAGEQDSYVTEDELIRPRKAGEPGDLVTSQKQSLRTQIEGEE